MSENVEMPWYNHYLGDVLGTYAKWPTPKTIISDGAYGIRGFKGDTKSPEDLVDWYEPHVTAWDKGAHPSTTLWFWNTEIGWANVHPLLVAKGWEYVQTITWDKGVSHIAGNVNGLTIRRFPVVSEICVLYQRRFVIDTPEGSMSVQKWLRYEWQRAGIPLNRANEACGVKNAATRKYLTQDWMWYWPPGEAVERMADYANANAKTNGWPFFSLNGTEPVTQKEWDTLRYKWNHQHGITNVWQRGPLQDSERLKGSLRRAAPRVYKPTLNSSTHLNQKPVEFMERIIKAVTSPGDTIWEPFGGLASASVAAISLGRNACVAEVDKHFAKVGRERLDKSLTQYAQTQNPTARRVAYEEFGK